MSFDSPYGITHFVVANRLLQAQLVSDLQSMVPSGGGWMRYNLTWKSIEQTQTSPATYDWTNLDDAVAQCNAAGLNACFPLSGAPSWYCTINPTDGTTVAAASGNLPNASAVATFATAVASRYNGTAGHGTIQALQVGNEEWDSNPPRDLQAQWLVPVVNAAYPAIKAVCPACRVGVNAVRKTSTAALNHITNWLTNLYTYGGGIGGNADWLDFHYYRGGLIVGGSGPYNPDPTVTVSNLGVVDIPKATLELATIQSVAASYGHHPEIWNGETGWDIYDDGTGNLITVTPALQSQYIQAMYEAMRTGGGIKCFVYTSNPSATVNLAASPVSSTETKSITQKISGIVTYEPAYAMTQSYSQQWPAWGVASPVAVATQRRDNRATSSRR